METTVKAPAKVNMFLRMDGKREDGYHLLYSCMQTLSLYDEIEVYVQNIDYTYAKRADEAAFLKWYAYNNKDFNAYDYYMNYPDLQNAFGTDGDALFTHFYQSGKAEHRVANKLL